MKVLSTTSLTRLIELIKSSFLSADNIVTTQTISCPADSEVVHNTGDETITGVKTFNGNNRITALQNSTVTYNTAPSSNTYTDISFRDKNGYEMGVLEHVRFPDNNTAIRLVAKGADGNWSTDLTVGRRADGTSYTSAPTPAVGDNSTKIATTAFVNTVDSNVVHKTGNETIAGNKTFSGTTLVVTPAVSDNSRKPVTTAYIETKFKVVSALPAFPDSDTYYFIPE